MKTCKPGDKIKYYGITATIKKVIKQSRDKDGYWDIEFEDINDEYRHWNQRADGGTLVSYK